MPLDVQLENSFVFMTHNPIGRHFLHFSKSLDGGSKKKLAVSRTGHRKYTGMSMSVFIWFNSCEECTGPMVPVIPNFLSDMRRAMTVRKHGRALFGTWGSSPFFGRPIGP